MREESTGRPQEPKSRLFQKTLKRIDISFVEKKQFLQFSSGTKLQHPSCSTAQAVLFGLNRCVLQPSVKQR